jgi:hypothetical protein
LLLRNRAPTLALISRAFYPTVVVTPLSSKLPQPLLLFSSAVICRAVAPSAPKVHSSHPLVPRAFYPAVVVTPLSSKLPLSCVAIRCNPLRRRIMRSTSALASAHSRPNPCPSTLVPHAFHQLTFVAPPRNSRPTSALASASSRFNSCFCSHALVPQKFYPAVAVMPLSSYLSSCSY